MEPYKLGEMEQKFAEIIWKNAPVSSRTLAELCDRKIFENQSSTVIALMTKQQFQDAQGEQFLNETFGGSLPQFFAAFMRRNQLTQTEIS